MRARERDAAEREALRRRVKQFYARFNKAEWDRCFALVDPRLSRQGTVELGSYSRLMGAFKAVYGSVKPWLTRLSLHLDAAPRQADKRPFAYVYVIWQDEGREFHMFRERWVKDSGRWFTRVAGLVPNRKQSDSMQQ